MVKKGMEDYLGQVERNVAWSLEFHVDSPFLTESSKQLSVITPGGFPISLHADPFSLCRLDSKDISNGRYQWYPTFSLCRA